MIQERYNQLINSDVLNEILDEGINKSRELAYGKYQIMKERMGIVRKEYQQDYLNEAKR